MIDLVVKQQVGTNLDVLDKRVVEVSEFYRSAEHSRKSWELAKVQVNRV